MLNHEPERVRRVRLPHPPLVNLFNSACEILVKAVGWDQGWIVVFGLFNFGLVIISIWLYMLIKPNLGKVLVIAFFLESIILGNLGILVALIVFSEAWFQPVASEYFVLNAAIKNTCFEDPDKRNCPVDLNGVIAIENKIFSNLLQGKSAFYNRDPQSGNYTLIVHHDRHRSVIFDSQLPQLSGYGADFVDVFHYCRQTPTISVYKDENVKIAVQEYVNKIWKY